MVFLVGLIIGSLLTLHLCSKKFISQFDDEAEEIDKYKTLYEMMTQWVKVKQEGKTIEHWLIKKGIHSVAIYGMNILGMTLLDELKNTKIDVVFGLDRSAYGMLCGIDVFPPNCEIGEMGKVDAVLVSAVTYFDEIKKQLEAKTDARIISLEEILFDV